MLQVTMHEAQTNKLIMFATNAVFTGDHHRCSKMYPKISSRTTPRRTEMKTKAMVARMYALHVLFSPVRGTPPLGSIKSL